MAARTRCRVRSEMGRLPVITYDTVLWETPAMRATSLLVNVLFVNAAMGTSDLRRFESSMRINSWVPGYDSDCDARNKPPTFRHGIALLIRRCSVGYSTLPTCGIAAPYAAVSVRAGGAVTRSATRLRAQRIRAAAHEGTSPNSCAISAAQPSAP